MKKMKRFLGIITAMIMAVTMLAGCGGNGKGNMWWKQQGE